YCGHGRVPKQPFQRVDTWRDSFNKDAWARINVRDGEKGPLVLEIIKRRVVARTERSYREAAEELLVVTRSLDENGVVDNHSNAAEAVVQVERELMAGMALLFVRATFAIIQFIFNI
ncbi:hypothetical protein ACFL02_08325, partial [Planctomycetota bacterium]